MNDDDDGGVDVGMDHGGETELKMQVPPLLVHSNAASLMLAPGMAGWLLQRCARATSTVSFERGECISLASGPAMSLERAKRTNYLRTDVCEKEGMVAPKPAVPPR